MGRPPVPGWIKNLILEMKNKNLFWGCKRIQGKLLKLGYLFSISLPLLRGRLGGGKIL